METKKKYLFLILLTIIGGTLLQWFFCCRAPVAAAAPAVVDKIKPAVTPVTKIAGGILISDVDGSFNYNHDDHINFAKSSATIIDPVSDNVNLGFDKLKNHLSKFPNKAVSITGFYEKNETYNGALPNLGIARANATKNYLVGKGISSTQIDLYSKVKENLTVINDGSVYKGPLAFEITKVKESAADDLAKLKAKIQADPLILYFNTGSSNISLSEIQKQKMANISRYLDKTTDRKTIVTGHTDSVGNVDRNTVLGQKRAEFAKEYLIKNGIPGSKIETGSKGPLEPIASNDTAEGRSKNRRTVITIN